MSSEERPALGTRNEKNPTRPDSNPKLGRVRARKPIFFGFSSVFGSQFFCSGQVRVGFRVLKIFFGSGSGLKTNFFRVRFGFRVSIFLFGSSSSRISGIKNFFRVGLGFENQFFSGSVRFSGLNFFVRVKFE